MTRSDTITHIRLALHDLGRDAYQKLPRQTPALQAMLRTLRIEQANSAKSKLRADIKAQISARAA